MNLDCKTLFKQNEKLVSTQVKVDQMTGMLQKIEQFTTLDTNKMIHEKSADEEAPESKLAL